MIYVTHELPVNVAGPAPAGPRRRSGPAWS